jgi:hypothetical protein
MQAQPFGSASHPYDIAFAWSGETWYARAAGQQTWMISQGLPARPATAADAAAWRADGSPRAWPTHFVPRGTPGGGLVFAYTTMAADPRSASAQQLNGAVGDAVGDGSWLTAAQFAAFPTDEAKLRNLMIHYVYVDYRAVGDQGMPPMDESLMTESINLLQDPLPPRVKAAVFRLMASLPGARSLGAMTDPLGRDGYAIAIGDDTMVGGNIDGAEGVIIVDPVSGSLLATEVVVTAPGRTVQHTNEFIKASPHGGMLSVRSGKTKLPGGGTASALPACLQQPAAPQCVLPVYYGPHYPGQVWQYTAIESAGWTNATPDN